MKCYLSLVSQVNPTTPRYQPIGPSAAPQIEQLQT